MIVKTASCLGMKTNLVNSILLNFRKKNNDKRKNSF